MFTTGTKVRSQLAMLVNESAEGGVTSAGEAFKRKSTAQPITRLFTPPFFGRTP